MSHGPGKIEKRIAELFAATRDRGLTVAEIADHAFDMGGGAPTRAQRLSATRAGHRLLRRMKDASERRWRLIDEAHRQAEAAVGSRPEPPLADMAAYAASAAYDAVFEATEPYRRAMKLFAFVEQFGSWIRTIPIDKDRWRVEAEFWRATADKDGTLYFHPPDVPIRVWSVSIQPAGVIWAEAKVEKITERNVTVRYAGETARLDRDKLWRWWALWRGVYFVSSRSGRAAQLLDEIWQDQYGHAAGGVPPVMQMPLADAIALLKVPANYAKDDVLAAFRREAKKAHPDLGGTAEMFDRLVKARDRLLAALGTSAPPPKPPEYAPKGVQMTYRSVRSAGLAKLGSTRRLPVR